ncbi:hypothetical protein ACFLYK_04130, partial [Candidatus Cloacimonadota bacterium]
NIFGLNILSPEVIKMKYWLFTVFIVFPVLINCLKDLSIFDPLIDIEWTGHYQNSEDSYLKHHIKWEYELDKQVVLETKSVPELNFKMLTYYFFDHENEQISFISFLNRDIIRKGVVNLNLQGELELSGRSFWKGDDQQFRCSFHLSDNGHVSDRFSYFKDGNWKTGHHILYNTITE